MDKIYMIQQLNARMLYDDMLFDEPDMFIYYASDNLEDIEDKIKTNWTDLWETVYPYVALRTVELNSVGATHDPIRIFEYDRPSNTYIEVAYFNMAVHDDSELGIQYLEDFTHLDCNGEVIELGDKVTTRDEWLWGATARVTKQFVGEVVMSSCNRKVIKTIHLGEYIAINQTACAAPGEKGTFGTAWNWDDSWSGVEIMKTSSGKVRTDNKGE